MHGLCSKVPEVKLSLSIPRSGQSNINQATSTFFTPKSARTLGGWLWIEIAPMHRCRSVAAKLLLLHCKYVIIRLCLSIAPSITILQRFNIWWPSIWLKNKYFLCLISKRSLKAHRQISKKQCFEKYCSCDQACQFSAL